MLAAMRANSVTLARAMRSADGCHSIASVVTSASLQVPNTCGDGIGYRHAAAARKVDPDDLRGALRIFAAVHRELVVAADARAAEVAQVHPHFDVTGVDERREECATRIDDHRAGAGIRLAGLMQSVG